MPSALHDELANLGAKWLKHQGFSVVATDLTVLGVAEQADAIGFRSQCSAVIESKVSRTDFMADGKKPHRAAGGLGLYRFYICPVGLIQPEELPAKWGLLYADGKKIVEVIRPMGNMWPGRGTANEGWSRFQHESDIEAEHSVLFSISRRLAQGKPILK